MSSSIEAIWQPPTQQQMFRKLVTAMSRPGHVVNLADCLAGRRAFTGLLATLVDGEVSLADPGNLLDEADWPLLEVQPGEIDQANYVLADGRQPPPQNFQPNLGDLSNPERGATLILDIDDVSHAAQTPLTLSGPGIDGTTTLSVTGLADDWLRRRTDWVCAFPLGVDLFICDATRAAAIPRTTQITEAL
jgi:alpha-D-ribose 1-methylphosphonate 5-triphosphate synthase subunit PhnH